MDFTLKNFTYKVRLLTIYFPELEKEIVDMKLKKFTPILLSIMLLASCALLPTGKQSGNSSTSGNITSNTSGSGTGSSSSSLSSEEGDPKVTSVTLSETAKNMKPGALATLTATVNGDAGIDKTVIWASSNTSVATVSNGTVTVASGATSGNKATITATSNQDSSKKASCEITVVTSESYTVMMYICGADLESSSSQGGQASADLNEILSVNGQPSDVNIVIQTGGAKSWKSSPGVASGVNRYAIRNKSLGTATKVGGTSVNMGEQSTLQSFLTWGMQNYKADHMALIMWNHGGGAAGCCYDENNDDDNILPHELDGAITAAKSAAGVTGKLDWIGYDCCAMSYADLASINAQHFKYMVSSQELENGIGWSYDNWLPTLYQNTSVETTTLLKKISDTMVQANKEYFINHGYSDSDNDQCLSVLNLQNMDALTTAFESFASGLTTSDWSKLKSAYTNSLRMGTEDHSTYDMGLADMKLFLEKAQSSYSYNVSAVLTALNNVNTYSAYGGYYSSSKHPFGVNVFIPADDDAYVAEDEYGANDTKFTSWRNFCIENGTFKSGGGWWY